MPNPYEMLGVPSNASDADIKKAYKQLAKKYHPDQNPQEAEKFKEVKDAYDKIKNAEGRELYEQEQLAQNYRTNFKDPHYGSHANFNFDEDILNDIFSSFAGGGGSRTRFHSQGSSSARHETVGLKLEFWESILGGKKQLVLPSGEHIEVNIPAGMTAGQKIRLKGQAAKINPRAHGDLLMEIDVLPDAKAQRVGNDIYLAYDIPVDQAVLGGNTHISCPLGNFDLTLPPYTNSGKKFRLKNKGVKGGDLYIKVNLVLPERAKERIQEIFSQYAATSKRSA